ncbi:hypothetical protein ACFLZ3_03655 [Candidatus Omnitrophota bacterium]
MNLSNRRFQKSLFIAGLLLRLPGLFFNGIFDIDQFIFQWGSAARHLGTAQAFGRIYGFFSYLLFGFAAFLAEWIPRYWWAPYKLIEILFEAAILLALFRILPPRRKHFALFFFWLNPWFILHGAWQGFWDGPHVFFALICLLVFGWTHNDKLRWFSTGLFLMVSAQFKPQGLLYFVIPLGIYLTLQWFFSRRRSLIWFILGSISVLSTLIIFLHPNAAPLLAVPKNYISVVTVMPTLSNASLNIWRTITKIIQVFLGQSGPTYTLVLHGPIYKSLHIFAFGVVSSLLFLFSARLLSSGEGRARRSTLGPTPGACRSPDVFLVMVFASLTVSQLGTMAHINHTYTALVLLIPLAVFNRRILWAWATMVAVNLFGHLAVYRLGRAIVMPQRCLDSASAQPLILRVETALASAAGSRVLGFQNSINQFISSYLREEPFLSVLSALQFVCTLVILREMFALASRPGPCGILDSDISGEPIVP